MFSSYGAAARSLGLAAALVLAFAAIAAAAIVGLALAYLRIFG